jgi:putative ABC transport system substrate-binding protein
MDRRRFLLTSLAGALAAPLAAEAQQGGRVYRIGYVVPGAAPTPLNLAFIRALPDVGLFEGKNVIVERRYMGGREEQYPAVFVELERTVDIIVLTGPPAALAARKVVTKVPVIFAAVGDPVAIGLVQSLAKPGGNFTGVAYDASPDIFAKRLGLLKEAAPALARVAALWSSTDPVGIPALRQLEDAAPQLRLTVRSFDVRRPDDFDDVFLQIQKGHFDGLLVVGGPVNVIHQKRIIEFAAAHKLPVISISRDYVEEGGLMSYGPNLASNMAYAAHYVAKILRGAKPSDLPVEQPTKFELVINRASRES